MCTDTEQELNLQAHFPQNEVTDLSSRIIINKINAEKLDSVYNINIPKLMK